MKKITSLFILLSTLSAITVVHASEDTSAFNQHTGAYADINIGTNLVSALLIKPMAIGGFGWSTAVGYNFTHYVGAEGGVMQNYVEIFGSYRHITAPYAAAKFTLPIGKVFSMVGKIGVMDAITPAHGSLTLPYFGIGTNIALTPSLDFAIQFQGAAHSWFTAGLLGAGLEYHFG